MLSSMYFKNVTTKKSKYSKHISLIAFYAIPEE